MNVKVLGAVRRWESIGAELFSSVSMRYDTKETQSQNVIGRSGAFSVVCGH